MSKKETKSISVKRAEQIMTGAPEPAETQKGEFEIESAPNTLKQSISDLANEYVQGTVSHTDAEMTLKSWSKKGYPIDALRNDFEAQTKHLEGERVTEIEAEEKPVLTAEQAKRARELGEGDLVTEYRNALRTLGYVANRATTLGIVHTAYSRLANTKMGWLHYGRSRSGKSEGLDRAYRFTHPYNRIRATSMTPGAIYSLGMLDHKFILGGELRTQRPGEDDSMQQLLRQFISESEITHMRLEESVGKGGKRYERKSQTVGGYASIAWTTTKDPYHFNDEFALRLTGVPSNEDADTTQQVQDLKAERAKHPRETKEGEERVIELFNLFDLSLQPYDVVIPFADRITLHNTDTSARGIFDLVLCHVRISALYNQFKRKQDSAGCLIATLEDYEAAHLLVSTGAFRVLDPISTAAREAFNLLWEKYSQPSKFSSPTEFRLKDVTKLLGKPRTTCQGLIAQLVEAEMIFVVNPMDTEPKRYTVADTKDSGVFDLGLVPLEDLSDLAT